MTGAPIGAPEEAAEVLRAARACGAAGLSEPAAKALLAAVGIRIPIGRVVGSEAEVSAAIAGLAPPFALKAISARIVHKSDLGAVRLGLGDARAISDGIAAMRASLAARGHDDVEAWLVEQMVPAGVEVVIGGLKDPEFGPMVMVGLGGVFVEVLGDVSFRICPISRTDAEEMLGELRGAALLRGVRGRAPVDLARIVDVLLAVGGEEGLMTRCAEHLAELDVNPLIVSDEGAFAADARMILVPGGTRSA